MIARCDVNNSAWVVDSGSDAAEQDFSTQKLDDQRSCPQLRPFLFSCGQRCLRFRLIISSLISKRDTRFFTPWESLTWWPPWNVTYNLENEVRKFVLLMVDVRDAVGFIVGFLCILVAVRRGDQDCCFTRFILLSCRCRHRLQIQVRGRKGQSCDAPLP